MTLAELVATTSLISDLGMGRPMERVMRQTLVAMRIADAAGVDADIRAATYYTSLLTWVACAADTSEIAELFGDEAELYADTHDGDLAGMTLAVFMARHLGRGGSPLRRVGMVGRFVLTAGRSVQTMMQSHCQSASELADRLALGSEVCDPLLQAFERWDGKGVPGSVGGDDVALAMRLVHLADAVEAFHHTGGVAAAVEVARQRRGTQFDPALVDCFVRDHAAILAGLGEISAWDEVIALDPRLGERLSEEGLDTALEALGDFADLKSPSRLGHSRGVAALAAGAAERLGLPAADAVLLRRAASIHDVGMIGVSSAVWDEPRPWSVAQRERARTHPYLTERMLAGMPALAPVSRSARRCTTSGSTGRATRVALRGDAIPTTARVLAAADVYEALGAPRPHRPAHDPDERRADHARRGPRRAARRRRRSTPCWRPPVIASAGGPTVRPGSRGARSRCSGWWPVAAPTARSPPS